MSFSPDRISVRDHMVAQAANGAPFFETLTNLGVTRFELQVDSDFTTPHVCGADGSPFSLAADGQISAMKKLLADRGVGLSAILLMTDFSSDKPAAQVAWSVRAVRIARDLGAPAVRVDPLTRNKELTQQTVRDNFIVGIKQVLRETADTGIDLGIENHGPYGNAPEFLDFIFDAVGDARLGMTLDTGNFYWWGVSLDELYRLLGRYAPRAKHTHIKSINYPPELAQVSRPIGLDYGKYCCALDEGNIDLCRVFGILQNAGYGRDFCIENESLGKVPAEVKLGVLKRDVEVLKLAGRN